MFLQVGKSLRLGRVNNDWHQRMDGAGAARCIFQLERRGTAWVKENGLSVLRQSLPCDPDGCELCRSAAHLSGSGRCWTGAILVRERAEQFSWAWPLYNEISSTAKRINYLVCPNDISKHYSGKGFLARIINQAKMNCCMSYVSFFFFGPAKDLWSNFSNINKDRHYL